MVQNTMRPRQRRRGSSAAQFVRLSALALIVSWTGRSSSYGPRRPARKRRARAAARSFRCVMPHGARARLHASQRRLAEQRQSGRAQTRHRSTTARRCAAAVHQERDGFTMERDEQTGLLVPTFWEPPWASTVSARRRRKRRADDFPNDRFVPRLAVPGHGLCVSAGDAPEASRCRGGAAEPPGDVGCADPPVPCSEDPHQPLCKRGA